LKKRQNKKLFTKDEIEKISTNLPLRKALTKENFYLFFELYFTQNSYHEFNDFHYKLIKRLPKAQKPLNIISFSWNDIYRILLLAYPIWLLLTNKKIAFLSKNTKYSKKIIKNITEELEKNEFLNKDFEEEIKIIKKQKIDTENFDNLAYLRGNYDTIFCTDFQNYLNETHKYLQNLKLYLLPFLKQKAQLFCYSDFMEKFSLQDFLTKEKSFIILKYPLINSKMKVLWPEKYNKKQVDNLQNCTDVNNWKQEFLLVDRDEEVEIMTSKEKKEQDEWIKYLEENPKEFDKLCAYIAGWE